MITSLQNPKIKEVIKLRERRYRDKTKRFLIEGYRELSRYPHTPEVLFYCPELFLGSNEQTLIDKWPSIPVTESAFRKMSYRDRPDGLLAIAPHLSNTLLNTDFLVVAEAIEKPGNLGTILRSSDAVGTDGVIVCDRCTDIHNPNVVRASVGTLFTQPVVEMSTEETLTLLKNTKIVAATPSADLLYTEADLTGPIAIAVGTEQHGLSDRWIEAADLKVRIPMHGVADSLNVATATTVLLYEAVRQNKK